MEKENFAMELAIALLLLALQVNAQTRGAIRLAVPAPRAAPLYQQTPARVYPTQKVVFSGANTQMYPAQSTQSTWYQTQSQSLNTPIQTNSPNGYAVAAPQIQVQSFNAPIQTNAPNGYAVAAPVASVDPTAICDAKWKTALKREIMNVDDWQCSTRTALDGTTEACLITGPTSASVFKNSSACGWKLPPFCDNTVNDLMSSLRPSPPDYPIPAGYTLVQGLGYFKVHTEAMSWDAAKQVCMSEGVNVNLAVPSTVTDYQAILDLVNLALPTQTKGVFVGITDAAVEGTFVTVTGQPLCTLGQVLFLAGEPNNAGGNENCLEIGYLKGLFMNDIPCAGPLPFVCEQPLASLLGPC